MQLNYKRYLDQVLGGWLGKSIGGTIGARFEGNKNWIEVEPDKLFPDSVPPNDDLDLQILWLKVIEERGAALTSDDMADAWENWCWYPFNEYGIFRRNWKLGIHPPLSGRYGNAYWETGMGCPIRSEIWGYVFPGAPDLAAQYAGMDGSLDHTEQSVGAEQMLSAMASMAFFVPDVRRLTAMFRHYLPAGTPIARLTDLAFECHAQGMPLKEARQRLMLVAGHPEACDSQVNVPFTFLGLLYGENDLEKTLIAALNCGYDTDCTMATAAALIGQILGASRIPAHLIKPIGDDLVMGIQYRRPDMRISTLAVDTARCGILLAKELQTGIGITDAPAVAPFPVQPTMQRISVSYEGLPSTTAGEGKEVCINLPANLAGDSQLSITAPAGWTAQPAQVQLKSGQRTIRARLQPAAEMKHWPTQNLFTAALTGAKPYTFGVVGEAMWMLVGIEYDATPTTPLVGPQSHQAWNHHYVDLAKSYIGEPEPDVTTRFRNYSRTLGQPAIVRGRENEIDLSSLVGLRGSYVAYLARRIVSPASKGASIVVGNTDAFAVWLNGQKLLEGTDPTCWAPFNYYAQTQLNAGENLLLVKLVRRTDNMRFSLGFRDTKPEMGYFHCNDWSTDLADVNPLTLL